MKLTDDLVARLRACELGDTVPALEAADEIERLRAERDALREKLSKLKWELSPDATEEQKKAYEYEISRRCVGLRSGSV